MKCSECTDNLYLLADNSDEVLAAQLKQHIAGCAQCYAEYEAMMDAINILKPKTQIKAPGSIKEKVLEQVNRLQEKPVPSKVVPLKIIFKTIAITAAVLLLILLIPFLFKSGSGDVKASNFIMVAIDAGQNIKNFEMQFSVRTSQNEDFEYINPDSTMVHHTLIHSFDSNGAWCLKKPGRRVVFDGKYQYLYIPAAKVVYKGSEGAGYISWMRLLLDPESILWREKDNAEINGAQVKIFGNNGDTCLTITTNSTGNFMNDYLHNQLIGTADTKRVYTFDGKTHLLKGLRVYLLTNSTQTLIFSLDSIAYNTNINSAELTFVQPAETELKTSADMQPSSTGAVNSISSKQAARIALEDVSKGDFETHKQLWDQYSIFSLQLFKKAYGGLQIMRIGEPLKSSVIKGEIVPYQIKLPNGYVKKFRLVLNNNNPAKTWVVTGGL